MKRVALSEAKDDLSKYVKLAAKEQGRFDDQLENAPRFLRRIEQARASIQAGRTTRLEDL